MGPRCARHTFRVVLITRRCNLSLTATASAAAVEPPVAGPEEREVAVPAPIDDEYVPISYPSDDEGGCDDQEAERCLQSPIAALEEKMRASQLSAAAMTFAPGSTSRTRAEVEEAAAAAQLARVQRENAELRKTLQAPASPYAITTSSRVYGCGSCAAHVVMEEDVVSKEFCGTTGRAYFVNQVFNVNLGPVHECIFKTGKHVIADLLCANCDASLDQRTVVGWKYLKTGVRSQKYKEGKYVVEEAMLVKLGWCTNE